MLEGTAFNFKLSQVAEYAPAVFNRIGSRARPNVRILMESLLIVKGFSERMISRSRSRGKDTIVRVCSYSSRHTDTTGRTGSPCIPDFGSKMQDSSNFKMSSPFAESNMLMLCAERRHT